MPATVNSTVWSCGMRLELGTCVWPRSTKKSTKALRREAAEASIVERPPYRGGTRCPEYIADGFRRLCTRDGGQSDALGESVTSPATVKAVAVLFVQLPARGLGRHVNTASTFPVCVLPLL